MKDRMKLSLPSKLAEKLVSVPVISFSKIFIRSYMFNALLCPNWPFSLPNVQNEKKKNPTKVPLKNKLMAPKRILQNQHKQQFICDCFDGLEQVGQMLQRQRVPGVSPPSIVI